MYLQYNKFLRKRANLPQLSTSDALDLGHQLFAGGDTFFNANKMWDKANRFKTAAMNLNAYNQGKAAPEYSPLADMKTMDDILNSESYQKNYNAWRTNPKYKDHPYQAPLAQLNEKRHAFRYAVRNPKDLVKLQSYRGMKPTDYLFGSVQDNHDLMRISQGPLGAFFNSDQRKQVKNNFGLMELIWRIKKFFAEFGNWKYTPAPSELYKQQPGQR